MGDSRLDNKEEEKFDAGPFTQWISGLGIKDFKKCVVDDLSLSFLATVIKEEMYEQRFAIVGALNQGTLYIYIQPSLPSNKNTKEHIENLEKKFNMKGCVVVAEPEIPGVVHQSTIDKRIKYAEKKGEDTPLRSRIVIGASVKYTTAGFIFMERSSLNRSISEICPAPRMATFYELDDKGIWGFDLSEHKFHGRKYTREFLYGRGLPLELFTSLITHIEESLNKYLIKLGIQLGFTLKYTYDVDYNILVDRSLSASYSAAKYWEDNFRHNKQAFSEGLKMTIYIACAFDKEEKPGIFWTELSDDQIACSALKVADSFGIKLDLNEIPAEHQSRYATGITALMYAVKNNMEEVVKELIKHGADIDLKDSKGKDTRDYATNPKMKEYLETMRAHRLKDLLENEEWEKSANLLKSIQPHFIFSSKLDDLNLLVLITSSMQRPLLTLLKDIILSIKDKNYILQDFVKKMIDTNNITALRHLLFLGVNINAPDIDNNHPLERAQKLHNHAIVNLLTSALSDEVFSAARNGNLGELKALSQKESFDITLKDAKGFTALDYALQNHHPEVVSYLSVLVSTLYCLHHYEVNQYKLLIESKEIDISQPIYRGLTPLGIIVTSNQPDITLLKMTLEKLEEKDIDKPMMSDKVTALFLAAKSGHLESCLNLLLAGADPKLVLEHPSYKSQIVFSPIQRLLHNWQNDKDFRQRVLAKKIGTHEIILELLKSDNPKEFDEFQNLLWVIRQNDSEAIYHLLDRHEKSKVSTSDSRQNDIRHQLQLRLNNLVFYVAKDGNFDKVKLLIENGADANLQKDFLKYISNPKIRNYFMCIKKVLRNLEKFELGEFNENLESGVFDVAKPVSCGLTLLALAAMRPVSSNSLDYIYAVIDKIKDTDSIDSLLTPSKVTALFLAAKENCLSHCVALLCAGANLQLVQSHPEYKAEITSPAVRALFDKWTDVKKMSAGIENCIQFLNTFTAQDIFKDSKLAPKVAKLKEKIEMIEGKLEIFNKPPYNPMAHISLMKELNAVSMDLSYTLDSRGNEEKPSTVSKLFKITNDYHKQNKILKDKVGTYLESEFLAQKDVSLGSPLKLRI